MELYPHQEQALKELGNGKILYGGVGTGKSLTAATYYIRNESPRDVYVITTAKKRDSQDWQSEFIQLGVLTAGAAEHGRLVVDSWNNLQKYESVHDAFFIFDEQRLVGSGAWVKAFIRIARRNRWILLSATPGDTWLDYIPVFVANEFYKNRTQFKREHVIYKPYQKFPKVDRYVGVGKLVRYRNQILVKMPYQKHTNRIGRDVKVPYDQELFKRVVNDRWHVYEERPLRDAAELFSVMRKVVNTDSSRLQAIRDLLSTHPRLIVFYNFDYELEMLRKMLSGEPSTTVSGATSATLQTTSASLSGTTELMTAAGTSVDTSSSREERPVDTGFSSPQEQSGSCDASVATSDSKNHRSDDSQTTTTTTSSTTPGSIAPRREGAESWETPDTSTQNIELLPTPLSGTSTDDDSRLRSESSSEKRSTPTFESETRRLSSTRSTPTRSASSEKSDSSTCLTSSPTSGTTTAASSSPGTTSAGEGQTSSSDWRSEAVHIAEWNGHKHEPIPTSERWVYLVQYAAGAEGWNCIQTDAMVFFSLTYSYKHWHQAHGRIDRLNTPFTDLFYYYIRSESRIDRGIWDALKEKRAFNESSFMKEL